MRNGEATQRPDISQTHVHQRQYSQSKCRGIQIARQGIRFYSNEVTTRKDPRGKPYYWLGGAYAGFEEASDSDCHAVNEGYVSATPITIDSTHNEFYATLKGSAVEGPLD